MYLFSPLSLHLGIGQNKDFPELCITEKCYMNTNDYKPFKTRNV